MAAYFFRSEITSLFKGMCQLRNLVEIYVSGQTSRICYLKYMFRVNNLFKGMCQLRTQDVAEVYFSVQKSEVI